MLQDINKRKLVIWKHPELENYFVAARTRSEAAALVFENELKK